MRKKIISILLFLIFILNYLVVFAETTIIENISMKFVDYDINAEYMIEIKDSANKKLIIKLNNMEVIESYVLNHGEKLDLKSVTKIKYSDLDDSYRIELEEITNSKYQLDYNNKYEYSIYVNGKLRKNNKDNNCYMNLYKSSSEDKYYTFYISYDKFEDLSNQAMVFGIKVYCFLFVTFILMYVYMKINGLRRIQAKRHGGIVKENQIEYCREIPKDMFLETAYSSLYYCSKISSKTLKKGIVGAFILKWFNEDNIIITTKGNKTYNIDLQSGNFAKTEIEQELYDILKMAAGDNKTIDNKEFKKWSKRNNAVLDKWYEKILSYFKTDNLKEECESLLGLKKFLLDYSLIDERKHMEVKIWEDYLIYAQILGISEEVNKQFSNIYPNQSKIMQISLMNIDDIVIKLIEIRLLMIMPMGLSIIPATIIAFLYYFIKLIFY